MATQVTSTSPNSPVLSPRRPSRIETSRIDTSQIKEEPPVRLPDGGLVEDTFDSNSPKHPPVPPNTPVNTPLKTSVQFGASESARKKERSFLGAVGGTVGGVARAAIQGTAYLLGSNLLTVPAAGLMALTGFGFLPALGVLFLGPLVAGVYGAVRGYQGKLI